ncbi:MAG TPA: hypothetical protein VGD10_02490 [Allosphingosinicella sp.]|uniref:hypothetical protein n=1 Tax=Allosphingosinicella sp. TaxID=2823234 RepID=UPI002ED9A97F
MFWIRRKPYVDYHSVSCEYGDKKNITNQLMNEAFNGLLLRLAVLRSENVTMSVPPIAFKADA